MSDPKSPVPPIAGPGRRQVLRSGAGVTGLLAAAATAAATAGSAQAAEPAFQPPSPIDTGHVAGNRVEFDAWRGAADTPSAPPPAPLPPARRVGFAVVGLGRLALEEILPAFAQCTKARIAALVSGTPDKLRTVAAQYGIDPAACMDYAAFDRIRDNPDIAAVYIVLPNAMHRAFTERAAAAGKHVLCEKPMATSAADASAMVAACARAGVRLMIAYRIQYEPYNRRAARMVRDRTFGRLVGMSCVNTQTVAADGAQQWRHKIAMSGGGSMPDIGLYCLNTARFISGEEPNQVWATIDTPPNDPRFAQVEQTVSFTLRFPSGLIANSFTSYGARDDKYQRLNLEAAAIDMPNAYQYQGQQMVVTTRQQDATAHTNLVLSPKNQFAAEIDHMAGCILDNRRPNTPGEEGVQDQLITEAIYQSARSNQPVPLPHHDGLDVFRTFPKDGEG